MNPRTVSKRVWTSPLAASSSTAVLRSHALQPLSSTTSAASAMFTPISTDPAILPQVSTITSVTSSSAIVFIGDSLTDGFYASTQANSFPYLTGAWTGMTFSILGQYGLSAALTAQTMQQVVPPATVIPSDALYAIVELGTNDVVASGETLSNFQSAYNYILTRMHQDAPNAHFICLGTWRDYYTNVADSGAAYNTIIHSSCNSFSGTYIELGDLYRNYYYHGPAGRSTWKGTGDWFHPNDPGHWAIASRVSDNIV